MKTCKQCKSPFEVSDSDHSFYEKLDVPQPSLCPDCRLQRRLAFRNERSLYHRKSDMSGKQIISIYSSDKPYKIYDQEEWWGDKWNPFEYGQDFDFSRSFFDQFEELQNKVPRLNLVHSHSENCKYTNYINYSKNSYLVFGCHSVEDCSYGWRIHSSLGCVDCLQIDKSKYCYECTDCDECYHLSFSQDCAHCHDSAFLYDCKGCRDCMFCYNLRNKQYCIFNEQYSKSDYEKRKASLDLGSYSVLQEARKRFADFLKKQPRRHLFVLNSENYTGDHIINSQNCTYCFNVKDAQDCAYLESCEDVKDAYDSTFSGWPAELIYECISAGVDCYHQLFSIMSWSCRDVFYCDSCHHSHDLFGCIGLRKQNSYCILNKQYSKEDYFRLRDKIIDRMKSSATAESPTGEFGEFFPMDVSPFAYNETAAQDYYPLTESEADERGLKWYEENKSKSYKGPKYEIPDKITDVSDDICRQILICEKTNRPFKITPQELQFYRRFNFPIPHRCPDQRHLDRMALRNPRKLFDRKCDKCGAAIRTTYSPDRPEKVYCEQCYMKEVY